MNPSLNKNLYNAVLVLFMCVIFIGVFSSGAKGAEVCNVTIMDMYTLQAPSFANASLDFGDAREVSENTQVDVKYLNNTQMSPGFISLETTKPLTHTWNNSHISSIDNLYREGYTKLNWNLAEMSQNDTATVEATPVSRSAQDYGFNASVGVDQYEFDGAGNQSVDIQVSVYDNSSLDMLIVGVQAGDTPEANITNRSYSQGNNHFVGADELTWVVRNLNEMTYNFTMNLTVHNNTMNLTRYRPKVNVVGMDRSKPTEAGSANFTNSTLAGEFSLNLSTDWNLDKNELYVSAFPQLSSITDGLINGTVDLNFTPEHDRPVTPVLAASNKSLSAVNTNGSGYYEVPVASGYNYTIIAGTTAFGGSAERPDSTLAIKENFAVNPSAYRELTLNNGSVVGGSVFHNETQDPHDEVDVELAGTNFSISTNSYGYYNQPFVMHVPATGGYNLTLGGGNVPVEEKQISDIGQGNSAVHNLLALSTYTLRLNVTNKTAGNTEPTHWDEHTYVEGENVTVRAQPEDGWVFNNWTGDYPEGNATSKEITITMNESKNLTADFNLQRRVKGTVLNASGAAIEDVNVTIKAFNSSRDHMEGLSFSNTSDENGSFVIPNITRREDNASIEYYRIDMKKWEGEKLLYSNRNKTQIGPHNLFKVTHKDFYLSRGVLINISGVGTPEPVHENSINISIRENHTAQNYSYSLEWMQDTGQWAYIADGNNLTILESDFSMNTTFDLPVQDAIGLYYNGSGVFYTMNTTDGSSETFVFPFNTSGDLIETQGYNITNATTGRYEQVGGISSHNNSFYIIGRNSTNTTFDRYNTSFAFEENIFSGATPSGEVYRHDGYWYHAANTSIEKRDDDFEELEGWWWQTPKGTWGLAHNGTGWYMASNETGNISEVQLSDNGVKDFEYEVKDYLSENRIAEYYPSGDEDFISEFSFYGLADREYMVKLHPYKSAMHANKHITNIKEHWDKDTQQWNIPINLTEELRRVSGYVDYNGSNNFTNISVVYYEIDARNKADMTPSYNRGSNWDEGDVYKPGEGFYNMSIIRPKGIDDNYLLFITAFNESGDDQYYGAVREISLKQGGDDWTGFNISLEPLLGEEANFTYYANEDVDDPSQYPNLTTSLKKFQFINATNETIEGDYDAEIFMDYSAYWGDDAPEVAWRRSSGIHTTNSDKQSFELPIFGQEGISMNVFLDRYSPRGIQLTEERLNNSGPFNISVKEFGRDDILLDGSDVSIEPAIYRGDTADHPGPALEDTVFTGSKFHDIDFANRLLQLLGGDMSYRITETSSGVSIHYANVDVSKSGTPDASFSSKAEITDFGSLWKFGSSGPDIYDKVLIGMPYNTSKDNVNVSIPYLYDEDFNVIWNASAGDDAATIKTDSDLSHYRDEYVNSTYEAYLTDQGVSCSETDDTLSDNLCYMNTSKGQIWLEIPHFSAVGVSLQGYTTTTSEENDTTDDTTDDGGPTGGSGPPSGSEDVKDIVKQATYDAATGEAKAAADAVAGQNVTIEIGAEAMDEEAASNIESISSTAIEDTTVTASVARVSREEAQESVGTRENQVGFSQIDIDGGVGNVTITFTVRKDVIDERQAEPGDVVKQRYDGEWVDLETWMVEELNNTYRFKAKTEAMSLYAVSIDTETEGGDEEPQPDTQGPDIYVTDTQVSQTQVKEGDDVELTVELENRGDEEGTETITLQRNGDVIDSGEVTLQPNASESIIFSVTIKAGENELSIAGKHVVTVTGTSGDEDTTTEPAGTNFTPVLMGVLVLAIIAIVAYMVFGDREPKGKIKRRKK